MIRTKKLCLTLLAIIFSVCSIQAQTDTREVTIKSSGSGATMEDAKQAALRSATEQAFGAFISSKTEIFNDQVVADQMSSVSSGNIKSFEILNQDQLPDGRWGVTLKAIVSIDKLASFVEAKGISIEIKGGMFALNIKQQLLNEQGEIKAIADMVGLLHETMQTAFDYVIKSSEPRSLDAESKNWAIPLEVTARCNKNIDFCANYFIKTLASLSLSPTEVETYKSLSKEVFTIKVSYQGAKKKFYLRKKSSVKLILRLNRWEFFTDNYEVEPQIDKFKNYKEEIFKFKLTDNYDEKDGIFEFTFPSSGDVAGVFKWDDERTLSQIEQMTGYSVKPKGIFSPFKNGGYVIYERDGHGLVVSPMAFEPKNWEAINIACNELNLNGYTDWRLPTREELEVAYNTRYLRNFIHPIDIQPIGTKGWNRLFLGDKNIGYFSNDDSSSDYVDPKRYLFVKPYISINKDYISSSIAVRTF